MQKQLETTLKQEFPEIERIFARSWNADLIVVGTHGRRGVNRILLGSDAERIPHLTPVPVLLARGPDPAAHEQAEA